MMTAITIKYLIREDHVFVAHWLEELHRIHDEIRRRIKRLPPQYRRGSFSKLQANREKRIESIRQLCERMQSIMPEVEAFSRSDLVVPMKEIETLLSFANESYARN